MKRIIITYLDDFTKNFNSTDNLTINNITSSSNKDQIQNNSNSKKEIICWILDSDTSINITYQIECNEENYLTNNEIILVQYIGDFAG